MFMCHLLVNKCGFGVGGVGFAIVVTCFLNLLFVSLWCWLKTPYAVHPYPRNHK